MDQHFKRHTENSKILIISALAVTLTLKKLESEPIFPHDTSPHDNTPLYQIW